MGLEFPAVLTFVESNALCRGFALRLDSERRNKGAHPDATSDQ